MPRVHPKRQKRQKILYSILGILLLVSLIPMGLLGWSLVAPFREEVAAKERELQLEKGRRISADVEEYVQEQRERVARAAALLSFLLTHEDPVRFADLVEESGLLDSFEGSGTGVLALQLEVGGRTFPSSNQEVLADQQIARRVREGNEAVIAGRSGAYVSRPLLQLEQSHAAILVVSYPLLLEGNPEGALAGVVSLQPVLSEIQQHGSASYTVYLLDRDLSLFAHGDYGRLARGEDMREVELVRLYAEQEVPYPTSREFVLAEDGVEKPMLGTYYPIASLQWAVFVQTETADAYAQVRSMMRTTAGWLIFTAAFAVVAAVFFANRIAQPIRQLAARTRSVAAGDFSQRVEVRSRNEIGELADTFNVMSQEIEDYVSRVKRASELNQQLFLGSIRTMSAAIDEKDPYTRGHSGRVTRYSLIIGRKLGLSRRQLHLLYVGGLLHDVGKIGIQDDILNKPAMLTDDEFEIMKQHAAKGANIMAPIRSLRDVLPILRYHHERYDGKGYPEGLKGEQIPLLARIVTVADTFDAMTTERPYQKAMTFEVALAKLVEFKGKACDPVIVDAMVQAAADGELAPGRKPAAEGLEGDLGLEEYDVLEEEVLA
jgi:HD-GYP domain-containing protein (c-di-GMP phosphodiesterase class II)